MTKTIVGLFDARESAERAVRDLLSRDFTRDDISVVTNAGTSAGNSGSNNGNSANSDATASGEEAGTGAVSGTVVGGGLGLVVSLGMLAIPGIGPVMAAGTLATVLGSTALGAGIGAAAGGMIGALVGSGVPEDEAEIYAEGVRRGGTLVTVNSSDDMADQAVEALEASDPVNVEQREASLRKGGWQRFDPAGSPYNAAENQTSRTTENTTTNQVRPTGTMASGMTTPMGNQEREVGNGTMQGGRVRSHNRLSETPVIEEGQTREDHNNLDRRQHNS